MPEKIFPLIKKRFTRLCLSFFSYFLSLNNLPLYRFSDHLVTLPLSPRDYLPEGEVELSNCTASYPEAIPTVHTLNFESAVSRNSQGTPQNNPHFLKAMNAPAEDEISRKGSPGTTEQ